MLHTLARSLFLVLTLGSLLLPLAGLTQEAAEPDPVDVLLDPAVIDLEVGQPLQLQARAVDSAGETVDLPVLFFSANRRDLLVSQEGRLEARRHGTFHVIVIVPNRAQDGILLQRRVEVRVAAPELDRIELSALPDAVYEGHEYELVARVLDTAGNERIEVPVRWEGDTAAYRTIGPDRVVFATSGPVRIEARAEGIATRIDLEVLADPVASIGLGQGPLTARTGDVLRLRAVPVDAAGHPIEDVPVYYSVAGRPAAEVIAPGASAQVAEDGRFVAEQPGTYTVTARSGGRVSTVSVLVSPRDVARTLELVGHGPVRDRHTSDLWVWEGVDGTDYAITGTWGSDGTAYIWDVSDPGDMQIIQSVQVDARTVNDVKVSADGRVAVISREGASNRRNGLVILDVSDPRSGVPVLSRYDDELTGGVHNVFIYEDHVYALSAGQRYDVINIEDPANPHRVGRFELDTPGHSIHDVWVQDGIAYSSNWSDGVVAVDVGGGGRGGSPRDPVELGRYAYPSGWNHAAYPYRSESTGKFYVFAGDEAFPYGLNTGPGSAPTRAAGWIHVIEWDEWDQPREVARYEVPEAGTHNLWIEDDVMYVAYYNGGLRVVDVSGELMGDLYRQGREIARFLPDDPEGFSPNAPMVWGPQPYKGLIFLSDWNSGLWAVRLGEER